MTDATGPTPQGAMARLVNLRIQRHPLLQPLRDAGVRILVSCHERAIFAHSIPRGPVPYEYEARITHPGWWVPVLDTPEDWAGKLATRLAKGVRKQWDAKQLEADASN